jgi:serine O-acetyltransferase
MNLQFDPSRDEFEAFLDVLLALVGLRRAQLAIEIGSVYPIVEGQFARIRNKYYRHNGKPVLRVAHNAQCTILLYHLARAAHEKHGRVVADKIYMLLRIVSSADLYYEVALPELWACDHPLGSVIGRGGFSRQSTLFFSQNCNVGNNRGVYPRVTGNLHMMANSSLLGDTQVVGNVVLSNGACALDAGKLADCIVFGRSPEPIIKPLTEARFRDLSPFVYVE